MLTLFSEIFACDGCRADFCYFTEHNKSEFIFYGEIIIVDSNHVSLKVIDIFRGNETRSIIKIFTHKDTIFAKGTSCQELIKMSNITNLGKVNDRIIIGLNIITAKEYEWDILGEYRLPFRVNNTPWLKVENDTVLGLISGGLPCFNKKELLMVSYLLFKSFWFNGKFDYENLLNTKVRENEICSFKHVDNKLVITNSKNFSFRTDLYNISGLLLYSKESDNECIINLKDLEKGVLILKSYNHQGIMLFRKVLNI